MNPRRQIVAPLAILASWVVTAFLPHAPVHAQTSTSAPPGTAIPSGSTSPPSSNAPRVTSVPPAIPARDGSPGTPGKATILEIVFSGGWSGFLIVLLLAALSIGALALGVEHLMTIRTNVLIPPGLATEVQQHLQANDRAAAYQVCEAHPSFLGFVLRSALAEADGGWAPVEKALEDAMAEQAARLFRKIEYLSVIGNIAPMVGLLGTVVGMIFAFQEVADTQGAARAAQLASGIYQALITTVGGLIVAIPSLTAFAIFRNRVDQLAAETAYAAHHALQPLKRLLRRATHGA